MEEKELDSLLKDALKVNCTPPPPDVMPVIYEAYLKNKEKKEKERKRNGRK